MISLEDRRPNRLLWILIAVSVGIHILLLVKISGIERSEPKNYIELEIRAEEKQEARYIPVPERRKEAATRIESAAELSPEPAMAPTVIATPDAMLQKPLISEPRLLEWIPDPLVEEEATASPAQKAENEGVSSELSEKYYRRVLEKIEDNRKYPFAARKMKAEGRAVVQFVIETDGTARDVEIAESSGSSLLDKAALAAVTASSPFPKPPPDVFSNAVPLEVGVVFRLND